MLGGLAGLTVPSPTAPSKGAAAEPQQASGGLDDLLGIGTAGSSSADAPRDAIAELLAQPNESLLLGFAVLLFGAPPGGLFTAALATLNGLNVIRNMPMLFDRIVVARVSEGEDKKS